MIVLVLPRIVWGLVLLASASTLRTEEAQHQGTNDPTLGRDDHQRSGKVILPLEGGLMVKGESARARPDLTAWTAPLERR